MTLGNEVRTFMGMAEKYVSNDMWRIPINDLIKEVCRIVKRI